MDDVFNQGPADLIVQVERGRLHPLKVIVQNVIVAMSQQAKENKDTRGVSKMADSLLEK
jgi:hypothetical protein